ncbi:PAAR domain-containing protein [Archangium sp.]|uniref:PAAR domain-containing protein n=1 Tax=Archangium sp. TaxID=1872627 RepID=UPI002D4CEAED|nr:PAAR domain-containing protein [Archangium sp.]HYO54152.1 PAAR domain-containing protein [Archangium sp.]
MPPAGRVGDKASCPSDAHGCNSCAHSVTGPASAGSQDVLINGMSALRVGDPGVHSACCGPNSWNAASGCSSVIINGQRAHRMGDMTAHCGGTGKLIEGSPDVIIGEEPFGQSVVIEEVPHDRTVRLRLVDGMGRKLYGVTIRVHCPHQDYKLQTFDEEVNVSGLCKFSAVLIDKVLQHGEWD